MCSHSGAFLLAAVALLVATAHGRSATHDWQRPQQQPLLVTSSTPAALAASIFAAKAADAPAAATSAVEDWSLVCKELCGAGLGGVPCASYCADNTDAVSGDVSPFVERILLTRKNLICPDLCSMQLGDVHCQCESVEMAAAAGGVQQPAAGRDPRLVCDTFCAHSSDKRTLLGCSACPAAGDGGALALAPPVAAETAAQEQPRNARNGPAARSNDGGSTTTPDWNELCESLCKTGDGGSLCNCDLSPFMKNRAADCQPHCGDTVTP